MRISDWSSPPCSGSQMITVPPPPYVSAHGLLKDRSVLITAAAGGGIGFAAAQRCAEEGARALFISDIHPRRLDEAVATLKKRSEEHTSELQTLMRISYTVFFLNKKK